MPGPRRDDNKREVEGADHPGKVEGERVTPLTPYVSRLLHALPRRKFADGTPNPSLFSSASAADGRLTIPRNFHSAACKVAGIEGLTLHGLRRSFKASSNGQRSLPVWWRNSWGTRRALLRKNTTPSNCWTCGPTPLPGTSAAHGRFRHPACGGIVATAPRSGTTTTVQKRWPSLQLGSMAAGVRLRSR